MSWYEATTFDSLALCRSLLDHKTLIKFDKVLQENGLGKLSRQEYMIADSNHKEVIAELEWLKILLKNSQERSSKLGIVIKKRRNEPEKSDTQSISEPTDERLSNQQTQDESQMNSNESQAITSSSWKQRMVERNTQRERAEKAAINHRKSKRSSSRTESKIDSRTEKIDNSKASPSHPKPSTLPKPPVEVWCLCRGVSMGLMVACDNDDCKYEWFHTSCVGLVDVPSSTWYCPICKPKINRSQRAYKRKS